jgi:hypothetical protein
MCVRTFQGGPYALHTSHVMSTRHPAPDRIRLSEALAHLRPIMSRSSFYGSVSRPGPRWTLIGYLDLRNGPPITLDRKRFFRWLRKLVGGPATGRQRGSERLGERACPTAPHSSSNYGEALAALCRAIEAGHITRDAFKRAVADLDGSTSVT